MTIEQASRATPTTTSVRPENLYIFAARPSICSPTSTDVWFVIPKFVAVPFWFQCQSWTFETLLKPRSSRR